MAEVREQGGIVEGIATGAVQAAVNRQAYEHEKLVRSGGIKKVGVNCHEEQEEEPEISFHPYRASEAGTQLERLARVKAERDDSAVQVALAAVTAAAREGHNTMPPIIDAVSAYATVGEVIAALRDVFGSYREPVRF